MSIADRGGLWFDIASIEVLGTPETFVDNLYTKAAKALGVQRVTMRLTTTGGKFEQYTQGISPEGIGERGKTPFYVHHQPLGPAGRYGSLELTLPHKPTAEELPLLHIVENRCFEFATLYNWQDVLQRERNFSVGLLASLQALVLVVDSQGRSIYANPYFTKVTGYADADLAGRPAWEVGMPQGCWEQAYGHHQKCLSGAGTTVELPIITKTGERLVIAWYAAGLPRDGEMVSVVVGIDVTPTKKTEAELFYLGSHDLLTGLYNRNFFQGQLQALGESPDAYPISIVCHDIDDLKVVNDTYSHGAGDDLLKETANLIKKCYRGQDIVARIGGDEFAVLLPCTGAEEAEEIARRVRRMVEDYNLTNPPVPLGLSVGVGTSGGPGEPLAEVLRSADEAMYLDKLRRQGKSKNVLIGLLTKALSHRGFKSQERLNRLTEMVGRFGEWLGLEEDTVGELVLLAQLQDVGYLALPDQVLNSPAPLTEVESRVFRQHPQVGSHLIKAAPDLERMAAYVLHHHERWDGSGYPGKLQGNEIPLPCRVVAIVTVYVDQTMGGRRG